MKLTEIMIPSCVKVPLESVDKAQAITELIDLLEKADLIRDRQTVVKTVFDRESVRSTGIGQGFAIPHGKTDAVDHVVMAVGKTAQPIDFQSIDHKPVQIIILLVSPPEQTGPHIQAIAQISRLMTHPDSQQKIFNCSSSKQLYQYLIEPGQS